MPSGIRFAPVCVALASVSLAACGSNLGGTQSTSTPTPQRTSTATPPRPSPASATPSATPHLPVLSGPIKDVREFDGFWVWGEAGREFCQQWTEHAADDGWFYGSAFTLSSNADVFVLHGLADPLSVADASTFAYSSAAQLAGVGDTVFFRTVDGTLGAWSIAAIDPQRGLSGTWYVQTDGSGDFTAGVRETGMAAERRDGCPHRPVLSGPIDDSPAPDAFWLWGGATGEPLCQQWSLADEGAISLYGTRNLDRSNVDVRVLKGVANPLAISDAGQLVFQSVPQQAAVGDTVLFRTSTGVYGAWSIAAIDEQGRLSGRWYVQLDGSGDFTNGVVDTGQPLVRGSRCPHAVLAGPIQGIPELGGDWYWGGSDEWQMCEEWSLSDADSGYFYGTQTAVRSCVDVHVATGLPYPTSVSDAAAFEYSHDALLAHEGDTVFFRNQHGYYGAWAITSIDDRGGLTGTWYMQFDGSGDFTTGIVYTGQPLRDQPLP